MTLRPSDLIKRGTSAWRGGRSPTSKSAHESENLSLFAVFPCHMPPRQILTIQGKVRKTRQLQSFPKHDVNARSNRFYCIMFGSCSIWRRELPAPWSLAQKSRYQFFTSQKNKLSSQNFVAPPSLHHHESFRQSGVFRAWKSCPHSTQNRACGDS